MKKLILLITILFYSCNNSENRKTSPSRLIVKDSIEKLFTSDSNSYSGLENPLKDSSIVIPYYRKDKLIGAIFTKEYFKSNNQNFTPSKSQIDFIENKLGDFEENFDNYYRQYVGIEMIKGKPYIFIQLIPIHLTKNKYFHWNNQYLGVQDDTNIRIATFDLVSNYLNILAKSNTSG